MSMVVAGIAAAATSAHAGDFTFSFTGTGPYSTPPGTVSGELLGLADNGTSTPTEVILFTDPDGIATGNLTAAGWFNLAGQPDSFTVTNGEITAADFTYFDSTTNRELILGAFGDNLLLNYINGDETFADPPGVTYAEASVDEPSSLAVLGMGLLCRIAGRIEIRPAQELDATGQSHSKTAQQLAEVGIIPAGSRDLAAERLLWPVSLDCGGESTSLEVDPNRAIKLLVLTKT
jgi:hypothetical protein